jgi:hypothetical protein
VIISRTHLVSTHHPGLSQERSSQTLSTGTAASADSRIDLLVFQSCVELPYIQEDFARSIGARRSGDFWNFSVILSTELSRAQSDLSTAAAASVSIAADHISIPSRGFRRRLTQPRCVFLNDPA